MYSRAMHSPRRTFTLLIALIISLIIWYYIEIILPVPESGYLSTVPDQYSDQPQQPNSPPPGDSPFPPPEQQTEVPPVGEDKSFATATRVDDVAQGRPEASSKASPKEPALQEPSKQADAVTAPQHPTSTPLEANEFLPTITELSSAATQASSAIVQPSSIPVYQNLSRVLVVPRLRSADVSWIKQELPDEQTAIYVVDDPTAELHPPVNKGREATVYLTYIIDHYDSLPDVVLFFHDHRYTWHNNILLGLDSAQTLRQLKTDYVKKVGYFPARCHHEPGCPDWIHLDRPESEFDSFRKPEERFLRTSVWRELHATAEVPKALSEPCCAQFGVTREIIRSNPLERYIAYREWLLTTTMPDEFSGRMFEYTWQYIFLGKHEYCPSMHACYCEGYGICFEGADNLEAWMRKLAEKEEVQNVLNRLNEARAKGQPYSDQHRERLETQKLQLELELERDKQRAYLRGTDPAVRAAEGERDQRKGYDF
ncbi:MAG: hypothetical protein M1834_004786 [Cirrosporium novae-zelandiae]|nr:MAG: hypothetical protein M1834_004786 [Cirrosporium novae-zelandiae]